jgi:hypothetical protein
MVREVGFVVIELNDDDEEPAGKVQTVSFFVNSGLYYKIIMTIVSDEHKSHLVQ